MEQPNGLSIGFREPFLSKALLYTVQVFIKALLERSISWISSKITSKPLIILDTSI